MLRFVRGRISGLLCLVALLTASCGGDATQGTAPRSTGETIAAFERYGIALHELKVGERKLDDCPPPSLDGEGLVYEVECWVTTIDLNDGDVTGPEPSVVLAPVSTGPALSVSLFRSPDEVEEVTAQDDGLPKTDPIFGQPVRYIVRDNVIVTCVDCSDDLVNQIRRALSQ